MTDWSGRDYAEVSGLQRAMITDALAALTFQRDDRVLDIGCGDGFLTTRVADRVSDGCVVGVDASPRMISAANAADAAESGPRFVIADARRLPFGPYFDAVVSFNALHWVPEQALALTQIAEVLKPGGRATLQLVCASARESLESVTQKICQTTSWATSFLDFESPFRHPDPTDYAELAAAAGLTCAKMTVTDREWDFGARDAFQRWCGVGLTAWTDCLPPSDRDRFVGDVVTAYEPIAGRAGLFRFTQMRAELVR